MLKSDGFETYRCDRSLSIGLNVVSLGKIVKAASNDDVVTIKADQDTDLLNIVFESPSNLSSTSYSREESERISEYDMKLMDIDSEHLVKSFEKKLILRVSMRTTSTLVP